MASILRSTLLSARSALPRAAHPSVLASASFASSSRHGLDFTRPRFASTTTTTTTTTLLEPQTDASAQAQVEAAQAEVKVGPEAVESHETPSTSRPNPATIPTPQPRMSVNIPPIPTPGANANASASASARHTPQFSSSPIRGKGQGQEGKKGSKVEKNLWIPESANLGAGDRHLLPTHTLHVKSTRNNVILNLTGGLGPVFSTVSGGTDKAFKNSQRSSYEAATQAATKMFEKVLEWNRGLSIRETPRIRIAFNGMFGMGREAVSAALSGPEGQEIRSLIVRVEDRTRIKIGGTRAPKPRRL